MTALLLSEPDISAEGSYAHQSLLSNALFHSKLSIWRCYQIRHWSRSSSLSQHRFHNAFKAFQSSPTWTAAFILLSEQELNQNECFSYLLIIVFVSTSLKPTYALSRGGEAILAIIPLPLVSNGDRGHGLIWTDWAECQVMLWQGITSSYEELSLMINDYGKLESIWCGSEDVLSVSVMQTVTWKYTDLSAVSISCLTAIVLFDHQSLRHYIISFSRNQ